MFINWKTRELHVNLVYYGPALSGKTTNLEQIHARANATVRSEMFTLNTHEDRTIFFDFIQIELGTIGGLKPKFGLYTVPGQVYYAATREAVLRRADGVVFVVDSAPGRLEDNRQAWLDLQANLGKLGQRLPGFPAVVQFNKRDLPGALPAAELTTALSTPALPLSAFPRLEAVATRGQGVPETLQMGMRLVLADVQRKLVKSGMKT
jgi:hypothetical protein